MAEQKEPQVMRLALTKPSQFSFNGSNGPVTGWKFTSLDGEEFNTFSKDLVEAWEKAGLVGKETDYKVAPNSNPKYPAKLVGIPGVFEGRQGGGGGWRGGSSGPMLTDRQAALFAALQTGDPLWQVRADAFLAWLGKAGQPSSDGISRSDTSEKPASPAASTENDRSAGVEAFLNSFASDVWPNKPKVVEKFLEGILTEFETPTLNDLTDDEVNQVVARLEAMKA